MPITYLNVLKKDAIVNVTFNTSDISELHSILLRHLDDQCKLDDKSWSAIEALCGKIDRCAQNQNQTESKEVNF
jgi:hypothetical protein